MNKEFKIVPPEGYEIDRENSTFEYIKFKPKKKWRDDITNTFTGYFIDAWSEISTINSEESFLNIRKNYNVFATEKQAKSALAMARISQIMANDKRFGGVVTDEEWDDNYINKYIIDRMKNKIDTAVYCSAYQFLAFHTTEQRDLFLKENEDLVKDYLMID